MYHCKQVSVITIDDGIGISHLEVLPVVRAHRTSALREVDLLVGVRVVERILASDVTSVAVESDTSEGVRGHLHLSHSSATVWPEDRRHVRSARRR